jgi:hypothetical protein
MKTHWRRKKGFGPLFARLGELPVSEDKNMWVPQ